MLSKKFLNGMRGTLLNGRCFVENLCGKKFLNPSLTWTNHGMANHRNVNSLLNRFLQTIFLFSAFMESAKLSHPASIAMHCIAMHWLSQQ